MSPIEALTKLRTELGPIDHSTDARKLRSKSRDRFAQSPVLRDLLRGRNAEIFIAPRDKEELRTAVAACARHRIPITVRGAGSGQFGQGVPLSGGAVIDVTALAGVLGWHGDRGRRISPRTGAHRHGGGRYRRLDPPVGLGATHASVHLATGHRRRLHRGRTRRNRQLPSGEFCVTPAISPRWK